MGKQREAAAVSAVGSGIRISKVFKILLPPANKVEGRECFTGICHSDHEGSDMPPPHCIVGKSVVHILLLFKLGLNHEMYSWVVHFLNYFISISERDVETER